jgi:protein subunit release factor A
MSKKELLFSVTKKDLTIQTFKSGGKGGQHQNTTDSGVRIIHKESGAVGESRDGRSQHSNKKIAFKRLVENPKFKMWTSQKVLEIETGKTIEEHVKEQMKPENIKVECKNEEGKWSEDCLV